MGYVARSAFIDECFRPWGKQLWALQQLGLNYLDIRFVDNDNVIDIPLEKHREYKDDLDGIGRKVATVASPVGKVTLVGDNRVSDSRKPGDPRIMTFEEYVTAKGSDFMKALEVAKLYSSDELPPAIRAFSLYLAEGMERGDTMVQENVLKYLNMMGEVAQDDGSEPVIALENDRKLFGNSPKWQIWMMDNIDPGVKKRYTLCFDGSNYVFEGIDGYWAYDTTKKETRRIHVRDGIGKRDVSGDLIPAGDDEMFVLAGQGDGGYRGIAKDRKLLIDVSKREQVWTLKPHLRSSMKGEKSTKLSGDTGYRRFIAAKEALDLLLQAYGIDFR